MPVRSLLHELLDVINSVSPQEAFSHMPAQILRLNAVPLTVAFPVKPGREIEGLDLVGNEQGIGIDSY